MKSSLPQEHLPTLARRFTDTIIERFRAHQCLPQLTTIALGIVFLTSRISFIMQKPAFLDEALHVDFAKRAVNGSWSAGLAEGKWLTIQCYGLIVELFDDSLLCVRLISVLLGLAIMFLLLATPTTTDRPQSVALKSISAVLYIILPYSVFYDRLALADQTQSALLALMLFLTFKLLHRSSAAYRIMLAFCIMALPMFKFSGFFLVPIPLILTLIIASRVTLIASLKQVMMAYVVASPVLVAFYMRGAPVGENGKLFSLNGCQSIWSLALVNGREMSVLFASLLSPAFVLTLSIASVLALAIKNTSNKRMIMALIAIIACVLAPYVFLFVRWYPRYVLPAVVPACLLGRELAALFVASASPVVRRLAIFTSAFVVVAALYDSMEIVSRPEQEPDLPVIRRLYTTGWSSGYGLTNAVEAINQCARQHKGPIRIVRSAYWDITYQGINLYGDNLSSNVQLVLVYRWGASTIEQCLREILADGHPVYLLFNSAYPYAPDRNVVNKVQQQFSIREVAHFEKPYRNPGIVLWQVTTKVDTARHHGHLPERGFLACP